MKLRKVRWAESALEDLIGIARHIAQDSVPAAQRVAASIRASGDRLGRAAIGRRGRVAGTYELVVRGSPYIIAYTIAPSPTGEEIIAILHVIHGARDWPDGDWPK